ncbi:MAG: carboxymuconolactone decarboxylase family protein [Pseudonocardia sp.]|uniref:carboxymuconolactone decarboxylase family protein n=1 Tax=unclassified Pseudonocardia TaxID=2619320 RepID=UPI00086D64AD|nr:MULTISPECIES: carboxymuconolactone decarboxylase family protein [unclassified Pseudonocardia]MBN9109409.1 carboxymuconolactone decarboxylase family protein [Pseudonocardia sp.]ODU29946.1 MAG: hypothetical protein ABS80_01035 [Pseudonocardia sp. SCN 72-51]ODV08117.1 MAG: hypothetical protein ABT15_05365 [Pseudonocardia sp. SCN 73-27]
MSEESFAGPLADFDAMRCWGELWARPGLGARDRSLVTVAILAAQSRFEELRTALRGAATSGCGTEEIQEVLLHAGIYGGRDALEESLCIAERTLDRGAHLRVYRNVS